MSLQERFPEYNLYVSKIGIKVSILGQVKLPPHLRAYIEYHQTLSGSSASEETFTDISETFYPTAVFFCSS